MGNKGILVAVVALAGMSWLGLAYKVDKSSKQQTQAVVEAREEGRQEGKLEVLTEVRERFESGLDLKCEPLKDYQGSIESGLPYVFNTTSNKPDGRLNEFRGANMEYFCPGQGVQKFQIKRPE